MNATNRRQRDGRPSRRRGQRGFTLLEALVAMAIAAVAFTALYRTVGQSSKVALDVEARVEAAMVARSVLASATFAEDLGALQSGQQGPWQWRVQVAQESVPITSVMGPPTDLPPLPAARTLRSSPVLVSRRASPP